MNPRNRKQLEASLTGVTCFIVVIAITFFALPTEYRFLAFAAGVAVALFAADSVERSLAAPQVLRRLAMIGAILLFTAVFWALSILLIPVLRQSDYQAMTVLVGLLLALLARAWFAKNPHRAAAETVPAEAQVLQGASLRVVSLASIEPPPPEQWLPAPTLKSRRFTDNILPLLQAFRHYELHLSIHPPGKGESSEWIPELLDIRVNDPPKPPGGDGDAWDEAMDFGCAWSWEIKTRKGWRRLTEGEEETANGANEIRLRFAAPAGAASCTVTYLGSEELLAFRL